MVVVVEQPINYNPDYYCKVSNYKEGLPVCQAGLCVVQHSTLENCRTTHVQLAALSLSQSLTQSRLASQTEHSYSVRH